MTLMTVFTMLDPKTAPADARSICDSWWSCMYIFRVWSVGPMRQKSHNYAADVSPACSFIAIGEVFSCSIVNNDNKHVVSLHR